MGGPAHTGVNFGGKTSNLGAAPHDWGFAKKKRKGSAGSDDTSIMIKAASTRSRRSGAVQQWYNNKALVSLLLRHRTYGGSNVGLTFQSEFARKAKV
jgi:hypothetical protein